MKIDVDKLIDQVSRHPEIYNPDHRNFSNREIRENIFNNIISKEVDGINGEILQRKWEQILKKYASFIRKLSNDDSSETILERFMEWPWTKKMRIFKPYVRKQFQIPEFQPAVLLSEMDADDLSDIPLPPPTAIGFAMRPRPEFAMRPIPAPRQEFPHPLSMPRPEFPHPLSMPRPEFLHPLSMPGPRFVNRTASSAAAPFPYSTPTYDFARGIPPPPPPFMGNVLIERADGRRAGPVNDPDMFRHIAAMMGLDQRSDGGSTTTTTDEETDEDDDTGRDAVAEVDGGRSQPAAKRTRRASDATTADNNEDDAGERPENGGNADAAATGTAAGAVAAAAASADDRAAGRGIRADVLPDLPLQPEPLAERTGPADFTVQEHTFLAWAKTMSTFTAKRQAKIKMKINKIMSEAEFEDLDDEFFAANSPPRRSIYTSRR